MFVFIINVIIKNNIITLGIYLKVCNIGLQREITGKSRATNSA